VTPVDAEEFGSILAGLAQDRASELDDEQTDDDSVGEETVLERDDAVWETTLRGIDGIRRRFAHLLGTDDRRMPMPYQPSMPYPDDGIDAHADEQRYLFLAAIRAGDEQLTISYSRTDMNRKCLPSMYLELAASLAGVSIAVDASDAQRR